MHKAGSKYRNFLAKWPDNSITFLNAEDEVEARYILDEIADPGGAMLIPFNGKFFFDLKRKKPLYTLKCCPNSIQVEDFSTAASGLLKQYLEFYQKQEFTDAVITTPSSPLIVHKVIMATNPFLRQFFEAGSGVVDFQLLCQKASPNTLTEKALRAVVEYLYSLSISASSKSSIDEILEISEAAIVFKIPRLSQLCEEALVSKHLSIISLIAWSEIRKLIEAANKLQAAAKKGCNVQQAIGFALACLHQFETSKLISNGLDSALLERLNKWNEFKDGVVWHDKSFEAGDKATAFELDSTYVEENDFWTTIRTNLFPKYNEAKRKKKKQNLEDLKKAVFEDKTNHQNRIDQQKEMIEQTMPEYRDIMKHMDISDPSVLGIMAGVPIANPAKCAQCNSTVNVKLCAGCRSVHYCSVECQKAHRPIHKYNCK